jgi:hypothetical protein
MEDLVIVIQSITEHSSKSILTSPCQVCDLIDDDHHHNHVDEVGLHLRTAATIRHIVHPQVIYSMENHSGIMMSTEANS